MIRRQILAVLILLSSGTSITAQDTDAILSVDPDQMNFAEIKRSLFDSGLTSDSGVVWRLEWSETAAGDLPPILQPLEDLCPDCAIVEPRPPRCRSAQADGDDLFFVRMETPAPTLLSGMANYTLREAPSLNLNDHLLVIETLEPRREVEPRPRGCRR